MSSEAVSRQTPFFRLEGDVYVPTPACDGFWATGTLNGKVLGGLLGFALERAFGDPDLVPARLTVDLMRLTPSVPLQVVTRLVRDGGRLRLADAEVFAEGRLSARASCQFLRRSANPTQPTWRAPDWAAPPPGDLPADPRGRLWDLRPIPAGYRGQPRLVLRGEASGASGAAANEPVLGMLAPFEARQAWARETRELVEGFAHTPFTRVATAADFASPLANSSEASIDFVNSDFTIYLHRLPVDEWLGFDVVNHHATDGVALGECWLFDAAGSIGSVTTTAIAQRQR